MPKRRGFRFHYFAPKSTHRKPQYIVVDSFVKRYIVLNIVSLDTSEQSPLCFDAFLCNGHKKASFARFLAPPFQNRSRSLRLFACKRALDASRSLPTCFGYGSLIPAGGIFQISFFNEIRLLVSEILLRNMKYAMRMKYLLRKGSSSYCKLTKIFLL